MLIFDLKIGFLVKNCIYSHLGMPRIPDPGPKTSENVIPRNISYLIFSYIKINFLRFWPGLASLDLGIRLYIQFLMRNPIFRSKISNVCVQKGKIRKNEIRKKNLLSSFFFFATRLDSRHFERSTYTVLDEESDFQVKNKQILDPEGKN